MRRVRDKIQRGAAHDSAVRLVKAADVILIVAVFAAVWLDSYSEDIVGGEFGPIGQILVICAYLVIFIIFARTYDAFTISIQSISELFFSQITALLISGLIFFVFTAFLQRTIPDIFPFVGLVALQSLVSLLWCILAHRWYYSVFRKWKAVIFYDEEHNLEEVTGQELFHKKFINCGTYDIEEMPEDEEASKKWLIDRASPAEAVFIMEMGSHERNIILKYCIEHYIRVYDEPKLSDLILSRAKRMHMYELPFFLAERYRPTFEYMVLKRLFDISVSLIALIVLSPVMLITAIAVKSYDKGPAIYKQKRLTLNGKVFEIYKFRSMRLDAEKLTGAVISSGADDPRVTPVGRFIRKYRLDELPQLINIIKGDMSIVGPRPERPEIASKYEEDLPEFSMRLQVRAGLTGYAQVYGKYDADPYDKLSMDLLYISRASIEEDLMLIFATIKRLLISGSKG
ncbi:MAG: sugar transferase [Saccharofermentans sp.]|nr:sugar transferase [Saccharofermentans sp.]